MQGNEFLRATLFIIICKIANINFKNLRFRNSTFSDQTITKSFGYLVEKSIKSFNGMAFRNGGRSLIGWLLTAVGDVGGKVSKFRVTAIAIFAFRVYKIYKHEGIKGVVYTLKTSHVLLMQSLAGYYIVNQNALKRRVRRDRTGIPLWIPRCYRDKLRMKDNGMVRLWTSLLATYRVLDMPGKLNLNSITDMGPKLDRLKLEDKRMLNETINRFWDRFDLPQLRKNFANQDFTLFPIGKSSPQTANILWSNDEASWSSRMISTTPLMIWSASRVWLAKKNEWFLEHMQIYLNSVEPRIKEWFLNTLWLVGTFDYSSLVPKHIAATYKYDYLQSLKDGTEAPQFLGKLGFKKEPAGKIRVFAMVDCWTQWLFYPLHKFIQDLLRRLDTDATFDQVGKLEAKLREMQEKWNKPKAFSFDLSSATDRLPVLLQVYILAPLLGLKSAIAWANVLITRKYYISKENAEMYDIENNRPLAYAVGQPMGALSSWVMLALTHHIIVQWAAYSAKDRRLRGWIFKDYIVLGDDIVLFDPVVANRYYYIMTKLLGVEIGLAKSVVSKGAWTLEFAKKYYLDGLKANMLPLRDVIVSKIATSMLSEFQEKHSLTFQHYLKLRGLGYKARSKITANFWNMSQRLRVYSVLNEQRKRNWLDWITIKNLHSNYPLNKEALKATLSLLIDERLKVIRPALEKLVEQKWQESELTSSHPLLSNGFTSKIGKEKRVFALFPLDFEMERFNYFSWPIESKAIDSWDVVRLRDWVQEFKKDNDHWSDKSFEFNTLTWSTYTHTPEKSFKDLIGLYREWCKYNSLFATRRKTVTSTDSKVLKDIIDESIDLGNLSTGMAEEEKGLNYYVYNSQIVDLEDIRRSWSETTTVEGEPQVEYLEKDNLEKVSASESRDGEYFLVQLFRVNLNRSISFWHWLIYWLTMLNEIRRRINSTYDQVCMRAEEAAKRLLIETLPLWFFPIIFVQVTLPVLVEILNLFWYLITLLGL